VVGAATGDELDDPPLLLVQLLEHTASVSPRSRGFPRD
jgi:hypothetical protein